jgi:hypothetical protein
MLDAETFANLEKRSEEILHSAFFVRSFYQE